MASGDSTPNPKGYTMGIDYAGPIDPDVDGNKYWMQGVDTSHTGLGFVRLQRDKSGSSGLKSLLSMDREMQTTLTDPIPMIRVHSDEDKSFIEGDMAAHLLENKVEQTHTGGHRPSNNAKTEKRIGLVSYYMKAILYQATGGTRYYDMLWGPAVVHANNMNNYNEWSDGT